MAKPVPAQPPLQFGQSGVALIEALISVLILSFGVLALVGLQASMNANATDAKYRAEASFLANELVGQMWVDQTNLAKYAISDGECPDESHNGCTVWLNKVGQILPGGSATVVINGVAATVTVFWETPGSGIPHNFMLMASVVS